MLKNESKFRWKGKIVTEKQYKRRLKQVENGKNRSKVEPIDSEPNCIVEGRRIVDLQVMSNHMNCTGCKEILALSDIEKEEKKGLGSIFRIRCRKCLLINRVPSGNQHLGFGKQSKPLFDVNSKLALGTLHSGLGFTSVNNLLRTMNIPNMDSKTFKRYEREVGPVVEKVAKESCQEATKLERSLTIQNYEELEKKLPEGFQNGFLIPKFASETISSETYKSSSTESSNAAVPEDFLETASLPASTAMKVNSTSCQTRELSVATREGTNEASLQTSMETEMQTSYSASEVSASEVSNKDPKDIHFSDVVRLITSYDMGYSTRANGKNYDSLNGYGASIGAQSGLVLDFITRNRKCKLCNLGHPKEDHDCRLNFHGSAKAMEAHAATELCTNSSIFEDNNVEVGVLDLDNDASTICAVKKKSDHSIIKRSDRNHTTKGVKSLLYKTANSQGCKGLGAEAIPYLHRCFTYAIAQNEGDIEKMAAAIRNIPYHAYDEHKNCGDWCEFLKDPENYRHTTSLPQSFYNDHLRQELINLFEQLADNAQKFSTLASTQANESLNGIMSRKAPKAICYSLSESADFRFACSVAQKNTRQQYVQDVLQKMELSPGSHLSKHIERTNKSHLNRTLVAQQPKFKKRRQQLKKLRSQLRKSKELVEQDTYESHISLLTMSAKKNIDPNVMESVNAENLPQLSTNVNFEDDSKALVFFDLETSGLKGNCKVLQISARYDSHSFNKYIHPKYPIPLSASNVNGITKDGRDLLLHGEVVPSYSVRIVVGEFLQFLTDFDKKCILVAHNCSFDAPRLVKIINEASLQDEFSNIIESFVDTLPLFREKFPKTNCSLEVLTKQFFSVNLDKIHDATYDVLMLQNIAFRHFTFNELISKVKNFRKTVDLSSNLKTLDPLKKIVSEIIRKRMAFEGINYNNLVEINKRGKKSLIKLLENKDCDGKKIIRTKKVMSAIISHFEQQRHY